MPVYKYRRIEDMPEPWEVFGDTRIAERLRVVLSFGRLAGSLRIPRGVAKFRSLDELAADRERYEQERIDRIRARNERKP